MTGVKKLSVCTMISLLHSPYYFFGSANSQDTDVLLACEAIPDQHMAHEWIQAYKQHHQVSWNINLITIQQGLVTDTISSKSTIDGIHNALYETYSLHPQVHPLPLHGKVNRHLLLNIYRCIRTILTFCTRTHYRTQIRPTLKGLHPFHHKLQSLAVLDFTTLTTFDAKYTADIDIWKTIPFYLGQTLSLMNGIEIYTKDTLVTHHPQFANFIYRKPLSTEDIIYLQQQKNQWLEILYTLPFDNPESGILILGEEKIDMNKEVAL